MRAPTLVSAFAHSGAGPALVLERSLGARTGLDVDLWQSLPFQAEVIPDLPIASSWLGLYTAAVNMNRCVNRRCTWTSACGNHACPTHEEAPLMLSI